MVTTMRMSDEQYAQTFAKIESTTDMNDALLEKLTMLGNERLARMLESQMGHRSQRGKSSSQNRRFVNLINTLNDRFNCKVSRYKETDMYEAHPAGWSRWAK